MTVKPSDFNLTTASDFTLPESRADLLRYWEALRGEHLRYLFATNEAILPETCWHILSTEFPKYSIHDLQSFVGQAMDEEEYDEEYDEEEYDIPEEVAVDIENDFLNFVQHAIAVRRAEERQFQEAIKGFYE